MKNIIRRILTIALVVVLVFTCSSLGEVNENVIGKAAVDARSEGAARSAGASEVKYKKQEWNVLAIVNRNRLAEGLQPLSMFSGIQAACDVRAVELEQLFSHTRPDGRSCFTALGEAGVFYMRAGENIAAGYKDANAVMDGWMGSSGHYANIMGDFTHIGVGYEKISNSYYTHYWVQLFVNGGNEVIKSLSLSGADNLTVKKNTAISDMGIVLYEDNSVYGQCALPVIDEMCTGYDAKKEGSQTVTVNYRGKSLQFEVCVGTPAKESVKLDRNKASMKPGDTLAIKATVTPSGARVTWTSSDASVAAVDSTGIVTAKNVGEAVITAALDSGVSASCKITVAALKIKSIKLNKQSVKLTIKKGEMGKSVQLVATVKPAGADGYKWTTSDEKVAVVDENGLVTSVGFGKCTITAKATDGSGKKAKCVVTVVKKQVSSIKLTGDKKMKVGDTQTIAAAVKPVKAYNQNLKWKSSNPKIASIDENGVVTALKKGKVVITCTARDGSKVKATIKITIKK